MMYQSRVYNRLESFGANNVKKVLTIVRCSSQTYSPEGREHVNSTKAVLLCNNKVRSAHVLLVDRRTSVKDRKDSLIPDLGSSQSLLSVNQNEGVVVS